MNWIAIVILTFVGLGILVFTLIQNKKDKNELEENLNTDYPKKKDEEGDIEIEDE
ncbi:MAG: hypothetical protein FD136_1073 [Chitinophagaceae bacterium]|nr:MAG: hypothetical protein FD136_1073 [Chitinophagaceae bacterium]